MNLYNSVKCDECNYSYKFLILKLLNITQNEDPINLFCHHINILQ